MSEAGASQSWRRGLVDLAFSLALSALAVFGFRTTFSGNEETIVGLPAVLVGGLIGFAILRYRLALLPGLAAAVASFVVFSGPVALRSTAIGGVFTGPDTVQALIDGAVNGWVRLLTTVPPAGQAGNLLAVPYLAGFAGACLAMVLAGTVRRLPLCLVPPLGVLFLAILFGTERPASLLLQGAAFGAVAVAWLALRGDRRLPVVGGTSRQSGLRIGRLASAVAVLAVAGATGLAFGPRLPLSGDAERYVLRDQIEPPFDPRVHVSPLAGYRLYAGQDARLNDKTVLAVTGLPKDARLRLGVLDDYDNLVWRATGDGTATAGSFRRVGARIPEAATGPMATVEVEVGELAGVWLPVVGSPEAVSFQGPRASELTDSFRYNRPAEAAAVPISLAKADRYEMQTRMAPTPDPAALAKADLDRRFSAGSVQVDTDVDGLLADIVADAGGGSGSPYAQVAGVAELFRREGAYSDGGKGAMPVVPPGHSLARLVRFLQGQQLVGNAEQYASGMALALRSQGIPARVVMGFAPQTTDGRIEVRGKDVTAWVEVPFDGFGWVAFDATPDTSQTPRPEEEEPTDKQRAENQPPPPTTIPAAEVLSDGAANDCPPDCPPPPEVPRGRSLLLRLLLTVAKVSLVPLVLVVLPAASVLALKARRRQRRRSTGTPATKVAAAWSEVIDLSRDLGRPVPTRSTRVEVSRLFGSPDAVVLAARTDAVVFGAAEPTEADSQAAWHSVEDLRSAALNAIPRLGRLLARLNLTSLRAQR